MLRGAAVLRNLLFPQNSLREADVVTPMRYLPFALFALALLLAACAPDACGNVQNPERCRIDAAIAAGDARLCTRLDAGVMRTWCITDVANATRDASACAGIVDERGAAFCRSGGVAAAAHDVEACKKIAVPIARDDCLDAIARSVGPGSLCADISQAGFRDSCAYDIGLEKNDADTCLGMVDTDRSYRCVTFVAVQSNATAPCEKLPQPDHDWCIASVAMKRLDFATCDAITLKDVDTACRESVQRLRADKMHDRRSHRLCGRYRRHIDDGAASGEGVAFQTRQGPLLADAVAVLRELRPLACLMGSSIWSLPLIVCNLIAWLISILQLGLKYRYS